MKILRNIFIPEASKQQNDGQDSAKRGLFQRSLERDAAVEK